MLDTSAGDDYLMHLPPMHVDSLSSIALFNCVYLGFHAAKHYMLLLPVAVDGLTIHVVATCCSNGTTPLERPANSRLTDLPRKCLPHTICLLCHSYTR